MIDARNTFRKVTRKIHDFTPEQLKNLSAVVWLYRGQGDRFAALIAEHLEHMIEEAQASIKPLGIFDKTLAQESSKYTGGGLTDDLVKIAEDLKTAKTVFENDMLTYEAKAKEISNTWKSLSWDNDELIAFTESAGPLIDISRNLIRQSDHLYKMLSRIADAEKNNLRGSMLKALDETRKLSVEQLKLPRYFWRQAQWLQERFPDAELRDVEGLVKLVSHDNMEANDWSITPGRYVGVAPEEEDEDFDFQEVVRKIHVEIEALNEEATELAAKISGNIEKLGL